jgi:hypothetical protein
MAVSPKRGNRSEQAGPPQSGGVANRKHQGGGRRDAHRSVGDDHERGKCGARGAVGRVRYFGRSERGARTGRKPKTGETLEIGTAMTVKFSADKAFKDAVNAS